jgi:hypothetical protein
MKAIERVVFIVEKIILKKAKNPHFIVAPTPKGNDQR